MTQHLGETGYVKADVHALVYLQTMLAGVIYGNLSLENRTVQAGVFQTH